MLVLLFIALAAPLALVAFCLGVYTMARYHAARLPKLRQAIALAVRDKLNAELGALMAEIEAGRELPATREGLSALMAEQRPPAAD